MSLFPLFTSLFTPIFINPALLDYMRQILGENSSLPSNIKITVHRVNKRTKLLRWLYEVVSDFEYTPYTFILTVAIIDKYKKMSDYQLLGTVALFIAAKIEECECKHVNEYVEVTDNAYTAEDILRMEIDIMMFFNFSFNFVLPHSFLKDQLEADVFYVTFVVVCYVLEKESNMYHAMEGSKKIMADINEVRINKDKELNFYFERNEKAKMMLNRMMNIKKNHI